MKFTIKAKFIRNLIGLVIIFKLSSCTTLYLKNSGALDKKPKLKRISTDTKHILYLSIVHIGKEEYYSDVSKKIDSITQLNYTVFQEEVNNKLGEKAKRIELAKKFRKIQGNFYAGNGYVQAFFKRNNRLGLINQPKFYEMGVDTLTAINADLTLEKLISQFEMNNGEIKLNKCDKKTNLYDIYRCKTLGKKTKQYFRENYLLKMRDVHLAKLINESESEKILVIYGANHYEGLFEELRKMDSSWTE